MDAANYSSEQTAELNLFDGRPERRQALLELLAVLDGSGYRFVTVTPATHARVLARSSRRTASNVRDVLGWSLPFTPSKLSQDILELLQAAGAVSPRQEGCSVRMCACRP